MHPHPLLVLALVVLARRAGSSTPAPRPPDSGIESSAAWGEPERQGWLTDFRQLIGEMSSHYANLEWAVKERHMDLARLRSETEARILGAHNVEEERRALRDFAAAFAVARGSPPRDSPRRSSETQILAKWLRVVS